MKDVGRRKRGTALHPGVMAALRAIMEYPDLSPVEIARLVRLDSLLVNRALQYAYRIEAVRMLAVQVKELRAEVESLRRVVDEISRDPVLRASSVELKRSAETALGSERLNRLVSRLRGDSGKGISGHSA